VDLLGRRCQKARNQGAPYCRWPFKDAVWHAPPVLLGRLHTPNVAATTTPVGLFFDYYYAKM
jgi:hypothetical protein